MYYKTLEEFKAGNSKLGNWTDRGWELLYDSYQIGINEQWVHAQMCENLYSRIYKNLICMLEECRMRMKYGRTYEFDVEAMLTKYRKMLYVELMDDLTYYCGELLEQSKEV